MSFIKKKRPSSRPAGTSSLSFQDDATMPSSSTSLADVSMSSANTPGAEEEDDSPSAAIAAARSKKKGSKPKGARKAESKLSFGGDEDESSPSTFVPKKSALSRSLHIPPPPSSTTPSSASQYSSSSTPQAPSATSSYSKSYLDELKASTPSRPSPTSASNRSNEDMLDSEGLSQLTREKYGVLDSVSTSTSADDPTPNIPSSAQITAAKARRTKLRANPASEDFIALDGLPGTLKILDPHDSSSFSGPHPDSRLVREEDELGDGDDDHAEFTGANERMPLGKKANREAARRMKEGIVDMIEEVQDDDESDEEAREWEEAQIRRASRWKEEEKEKPKKAYTPHPIPTPTTLPSLSSASARLASALSAITLSHADHSTRLEQVSADQAALEAQEADLRKEVERVEKKWEWAVEFKGWVEEVGKFLEAKFPILEKLESDHLHLISERSALISRRRLEDDSDDLSLCYSIPPLPLPTDTFPDIPTLLTLRETRQAARLARLDSTFPSALPPASDESGDLGGYATDAELSPSDAADYDVASSDLASRLGSALFGDVKAEEFRDPDRGLAVRFGRWRAEFGEDYEGAFGGLALVQAWEFWARGEMVGWEPLRSNQTLESFSFYASLYAYSRPSTSSKSTKPSSPSAMDDDESDEDDEPALGPDGDLVPEIVSKAVIPLLIRQFSSSPTGNSGGYDPYSSSETRRAVDLLEHIEELLGSEKRSFQSLVAAVLSPFTPLSGALTELSSTPGVVVPLPPSSHSTPDRSLKRFLARLMKLLRNLLAFLPFSPMRVPELANELVEVGRLVAEKEGNWEMGGKVWAGRVLGVFEKAGKGVLEEGKALRLKSGPPRGW